MGNGGHIGSRNLPQPSKAGGVWQVEEAYLADRDAAWPRWPTNSGLPFDERLRVWLESDYGLYSDVDATVPTTADAQNVRSWVNRGNGGRLSCGLASAPVRSTTQGFAGVSFPASSQRHFDPILMDRRAYNYTFAASWVSSTNARARISTPAFSLETVAAVKSEPGLVGGTSSLAAGNGAGAAISVAPASANLNIEAQLSYVDLSAWGPRLLVSSGSGITLAPEPARPATGAVEVTVGGVKGVTPGATQLVLYALLWYTSDVPMTKAELQQVYAYLAAKYSRPIPTLA